MNAPYRHVVLFRFRDAVPEARVEEIAQAFGTMVAQIPLVKGYEWGRNSSPEGLDQGYTHCFLVTFASPADRDAYLPHPVHQAFCRDYLDGNLEKACVVDFGGTAAVLG